MASESAIHRLDMEVVPYLGAEIFAIRIDVDAGSCDYYGWEAP